MRLPAPTRSTPSPLPVTTSRHVQAGFVSGAAVSATLLGEPDVGLLTPPEMARKCNQICNSNPNMLIIADADTGGGNALNVQRTIRQLIVNGCKGCILEDQARPCQLSCAQHVPCTMARRVSVSGQDGGRRGIRERRYRPALPIAASSAHPPSLAHAHHHTFLLAQQ